MQKWIGTLFINNFNVKIVKTHFWRKEMPKTIWHTRQRHASEEENNQDNIRKRSGYIYDLKKSNWSFEEL